MKTLVFLASPNKDGNTVKLLSSFAKGLDGEIEIINAYKVNVKPCNDCRFCYTHEGQCAIKDDMKTINDKLECSDNVVVASPIYFSSFPAPMKSIIDRCQVYWSKKYILNKREDKRKKKGILIADGGTLYGDMFNCIESTADYFMKAVDAELTYKIYASNTDKLPAEENEEALNQAYSIGKNLNNQD